MRAFDNWNSYLDDEGNLFHGKFEFCVKGTTTRKTIYNDAENPLTNPVYSDNLGRTRSQVFLADDDYTVVYWKYVGNGNMETDDDKNNWKDIYTTVSDYPIGALNVKSNSATTVSNLSHLRGLDPNMVPSVDGNKIAMLAGYYTAGDCPVAYYIWDAANKEIDDAASIVKYNQLSVGRWLLIPTGERHLDCRHFGVFPNKSINDTDTTYTSQIARLAAYANKVGCDLFFPQLSNGLCYYLFDGTNTCQIKGDIFFAPMVRLHVKTGASTLISCNQIHKESPYLWTQEAQKGTIGIVSNTINTSWYASGCASDSWVSKTSIVDTSDRRLSFVNKTVTLQVSPAYGCTFDNCLLESNHKIDSEVTIKNMVIDEGWFAANYNYGNLHSFDNTILLDNFSDVNTYITLKNKQLDANYGDLNERTVKNQTLLSDCIAENATFDNVTIQGNAELHNISGTYRLNGLTYLNLVDCWMTIVGDGNIAIGDLHLRRGHITKNGTGYIQVVKNCYLDNVAIDVQLFTKGAITEIRNSVINKQIDCTDITLVNNDINATVYQQGSGNIDFRIDRNSFLAGGGHHVTATVANSYIVGKWTNNFSALSTHFIVLDRTNLNPYETLHSYVYDGNSGKHTLQKHGTWTYKENIQPYNVTVTNGLQMEILSGVEVNIWCYGHPWTVQFFSVGTDSVTKRCLFSLSPIWKIPGLGNSDVGGCSRIDSNEYAPTYAFPTKFKEVSTVKYNATAANPYSTLEFVSGYTWKIGFGNPGTQGSLFYVVDDGSSPFGYGDKAFFTKDTTTAKLAETCVTILA